MGGPAAREMMRNMMAAENDEGFDGHEALLGSMGSTWAADEGGRCVLLCGQDHD